jgi:glycerophosphoryl diester phosphodiesterase
MPTTFFETPRPRVFGHRGAAGEAPENTLPSFDRAAACGVDIFELDVHATRDGTVVVLHDPTLERTTDGAGPVKDLTWAELQRLDAGHHFTLDGRTFPFRGQGVRVPSLAELFARFPDSCFNIEVKQSDPVIARDVVQLIFLYQLAPRVMLAAEHHEIMEQIRAAAAGSIATSYSAAEVGDFVFRLQSGSLAEHASPGRALQIPVAFNGVDLVTAESIAAAHARGLEVHVWTINDRAEMERLFALGVDGVISDLPAERPPMNTDRVHRGCCLLFRRP